MNHRIQHAICLLICLSMLVSACQTSATPAAPTQPPATAIPTNPPPTQPPPPTDTAPPPSATPTQEPPTATLPPPTATKEPGLPPLPPEAQRIEFESEDGTVLVGMYYPAAINPAPVVVLMHWAGGDKNDWVYVGMAAWLQNRGAEIPTPPGALPFDTPYAFMAMPDDLSFGVFLFDFRDYGESAASNAPMEQLRDLWVMDARAAYAKAATLPGVDPEQVAGIGASIGADGAIDACGEGCLGALSLGPGDYLNIAYAEAVQALDEAAKPAWCVAAEDDPTSAQTCRAASGTHYQMHIYPSGGHAMRLFRSENNLDPLVENLILDFLRLVFIL